MPDYRTIDHTADFGIEVTAKDFKALFVKAAAAMFDCIARPLSRKKCSKKIQTKIVLEEENSHELFLRWLAELLSLSECNDIVFTEFNLRTLTEKKLEAIVFGTPRGCFRFIREIKAVTYHDLVVKKEARRYYARVIFDV